MTNIDVGEDSTTNHAKHRPRLPRRPPDRVWARPATMTRCAMCGSSTQRGESEVEVGYDADDRSAARIFYLHARCFTVLERERWNLD